MMMCTVSSKLYITESQKQTLFERNKFRKEIRVKNKQNKMTFNYAS
jgi:hypothetical protein